MQVRPAGPGDWPEICSLIDRAFAPSTYESKLVSGLRLSERELIEWLLVDDGRVVAHLAFTRAYKGAAPIGHHLAPVAVLPESQRRGFGTRLIREALCDPRIDGSPVFVLGDPGFYSRFGFRQVDAPRCPFDPGNRHFQVLGRRPDGEFTIGYEPEFSIG